MAWEFNLVAKEIPKLNSPILIEGLPGIGNVGKIAADFMIDNLGAVKLYDIFSYDLPNSVFVNEDSIVELPTIEIYFKRIKGGKHDLVILTGDVQPSEDRSCYEFSDKLVDVAKSLGVVEIITLGGIGLPEVPAVPRVFCTGNNKKAIDEFVKGTPVNKELYNVIGPIIGVTGIVLGLAERKGVPAICLLAETFGHPLYVGVRGGREVLSILNKKLSIGVKLKDLDAEIKEMESEGILPETKVKGKKAASLKKVRSLNEAKTKKETSYIG
jgi:hypothetical protein